MKRLDGFGEGIWDKTFVSLDFDKIFAVLSVIEGENDGVFVIVSFESPFSAIGVTGVLCNYALANIQN